HLFSLKPWCLLPSLLQLRINHPLKQLPLALWPCSMARVHFCRGGSSVILLSTMAKCTVSFWRPIALCSYCASPWILSLKEKENCPLLSGTSNPVLLPSAVPSR